MNDHVYDARAIVQEAEVLSVDDTGQVQTATVRMSSGAVYSNIEVIQEPGSAGNPVLDGAVAQVWCIGGDPANMRATISNPSVRFGGQQPGERTIYGPDGTRVSVRLGGIVDIKGGNQINIDSPNAVITATSAMSINAPAINLTGTVNLTGNLIVTEGSITVDGVKVDVP